MGRRHEVDCGVLASKRTGAEDLASTEEAVKCSCGSGVLVNNKEGVIGSCEHI